MGLLDFLTRKNYEPESKKGVAWDTAGSSFGGSSSDFRTKLSNPQAQLQSYTDWVYAAARAIAEDVATIDFNLYINRTGQRSARISKKIMLGKLKELQSAITVKGAGDKSAVEEIEEHPLLDLLYKPNPFMTKDEFIELTVLHMELTGEAFWYIIRNGAGVPVELWPLMPYLVTIKKSAETFIGGYAYSTPSGASLLIQPEDVIHHKYMNPSDLYRGQSVVMAAARAVDTDANAADYNRNFFYNSAMPSLTLEADGTLSDETWKRLESQWDGKFSGTANAHKTAILEEGLKVNVLSMAQKDMEFLESRKFNRDQILALFRVSGAILGIQESSNRATAEAADYTFSRRVVKPKMMRLNNRLTEDLAGQFDHKLVLTFEDPVPSDKNYGLKEKTASLNSWKTINEVRIEEGLDEIEGGGVLYQAVNLLPVGESRQPEDDGDKDLSKAVASLLSTQETILKHLEAKKKIALYDNTEEREVVGGDYNEVVVKMALGYESEFLKASRSLFDEQKKEVLKNLKKQHSKTMKPTVAKAQPSLFDISKAIDLFQKLYNPIYRENIGAVGSEAMLMVGATGFEVDTPAISRFYKSRSKRISKDVNKETDRLLKTAISEGVASGETVADLSARVENIYGAASGYRAERIARSETIKASNYASDEGWTQSGVVEGKEWFTAKDERTCQYCGPMDGKIVGLKQNYFIEGEELTGSGGGKMKLDYEDVDTPPLHSNCRCTLLPVLKDL